MKRIIDFLKNNWILMFIVIQPLLDMFYYFQIKNNMTPITWLIRIITLALIVIILFIKSKNKKRLCLLLSPYAIFYIMHILNLYRIKSLNFVSDTKYFIFVFMLPVLTILFIDYLKNRKLHLEKIKKGLFYAFIIISISLLLAFITSTYQCTYTLQENCVGVLGWFFPSDTVFLIICALAPWALYYSLNKGGIMYGIIVATAFLVLYTNASKSCYITLILSLAAMIYIIIAGKEIKNKIIKLSFTIAALIMALCLYNKSMTFYRQDLASMVHDDYSEVIKNQIDNLTGIDSDKLINNKDVITSNDIGKSSLISILKSSYIYREIIDIHGEEAVLKAMNYKVTPKVLSDNRYRKIVNAKIEFNNSDTITKFLGFGYSKVANYSMDLENDLEAIFFFYGYIGFTIYLLFFIAFIGMLFKTFIKKPNIIFNNYLVILVFLFALVVFGGEYTGAFLRKPNSNVFLVFYLTLIYFECMKISKKNNGKVNNETLIPLFDKTYKNSKETYIKKLEKNIKDNNKTFIVTANPEAFMLAEKNKEYMNMLLDKNTEIVPDGIGLVKAGRILRYDIKERIPGIDIAEELLKYANKYKKKLYLFGSKPEVIEKMSTLIKDQYPLAELIGAEDGYVKDKDKIFQDMIKKEPDIILVALGMPKQEELIYKYLKDFKKGIFVGVGGSFDVLSGSKKRAPKIFIKLNIEWLYRIAKEPKRIKRFYNNNIKFISKVYKINH